MEVEQEFFLSINISSENPDLIISIVSQNMLLTDLCFLLF